VRVQMGTQGCVAGVGGCVTCGVRVCKAGTESGNGKRKSGNVGA
jgi:hypothetical protein